MCACHHSISVARQSGFELCHTNQLVGFSNQFCSVNDIVDECIDIISL